MIEKNKSMLVHMNLEVAIVRLSDCQICLLQIMDTGALSVNVGP